MLSITVTVKDTYYIGDKSKESVLNQKNQYRRNAY